jgi:D-beta-D-heptose 7-phosphate kinase/D-beta-D-heptose 1-phosphate adenosyltransferase
VSDELAKATIQYANDANKPLVIDPKGINWTKYQGGFIVTPNLSELAAVFGSSLPNTDAAVENAGKLIKEQFSLQNLLVTRSECGMTLFTNDEIIHYPSHKVEVFDVSGAGDTVVAVLAAGLAAGLGLPQSVELANRAGGFVVSKFGTYPISIEELKALI